jgi:hypothetical protein
MNECASLGFFVNNILKDSRVAVTQLGWLQLISTD